MIKAIVDKLYEIGAFKFGSFKLKSGILSPIYVDLRLIVSYPELLQQIAEAFYKKVQGRPFDLVCGVPYTALPIATALSIAHNVPMVMRRKEVKDYGTRKLIEGVFSSGQNCLVIEDLITSAASVFETVAPLEEAGLKVTDCIVLLDREQGGRKKLEEKNIHLHSLITMTELLNILHQEKKITSEMQQEVLQFIQSHQVL